MSIRSKLRLSTTLQIMLVMLIGVVLVISSLRLNQSKDKSLATAKISNSITEMRFVTFENLSHRDERSLEQWHLKYASTEGLFATSPRQSFVEQQLLLDMLSQHKAIKSIFERLLSSYEETSTSKDSIELKDFQERLTNQLLIKQQVQVSDAVKLADLNQAEVRSQQIRFNLLILLAILIMFLVTIANSSIITRTINKSLSALQKGTDAYAEGKLDYRIKIRANDEFGRLAKDFNSMAQSLGEIDEAKNRFIMLVSHQLRTPLATIKWYAEELNYKKEKMEPAKQRRYLNQIHSSNERIIKLVQTLLSFVRIDFELPPKPEPVQVDVIIDPVLKDLSSQIKLAKTNVIVDAEKGLKPISIDPSWAQAIFQNLISNAIKYSPAKSDVIVKVKQDTKDIIISVQDKGYGIPEAQKNRIFSKLFRADNIKNVTEEGIGLGLYITKTMVERAGGQIWFESTEGKGSIFYVKLPFEYKANK